MTLSLLTEPDDKVAAYRPVIWEVQSTRTAFEQQGVTSVSDSGGGFCKFEFGTAHTFKTFDVITGSLFTDTSYNVRAQVTSFGATSINVNLVFNATDTGTCTRTNNDFKTQATLYTKGATINWFGNGDIGGGEVLFTTLSDHGYSVGDFVSVTGNIGNYDGIHEVTQITSSIGFAIKEIFVSSENGSLLALNRLGIKKQAEIIVGSDSLFRFNFANFLAADLTHDIAPLSGTTEIVSPNNESENEYLIEWVEQYNNTAGLLADQDTLTNDTGKQAYNATLQHEEAQDLSAFTIENSSKRFLTNTPQLAPFRRNEEIQLHFITTASTYKVRTIEYDAITGGSPTATTTASQTVTDDRGIVTVDASAFLASTLRVEVRLMNDAETQFFSEIKSFKVLPSIQCDNIRVSWLNRLGGIDAYTFAGDRQRKISSDKSTYTKGLQIGFDVGDSGDEVLGVEADNGFNVWSDFVNEEFGIWLEELITSQKAWVQVGSDHIPIIVNTNQWVSGETVKLTQLNLTYRKSNRLILQNG